MADTDDITGLEGGGNHVQYVIQGEDGTLQPFTGDPSQLVMAAGGNGQVQYVEHEVGGSTEGAYVPNDQSQVQYVAADAQHIDQDIQGSTEDVFIPGDQNSDMQNATPDSQHLKQGIEQSTEGVCVPSDESQVQYITSDSQHLKQATEQSTEGVYVPSDGSQVQYMTSDGQHIAQGMEGSSEGLYVPSDQSQVQYVTSDGQLIEQQMGGLIDGVSVPEGQPQIQYVTPDGQPVHIPNGESTQYMTQDGQTVTHPSLDNIDQGNSQHLTENGQASEDIVVQQGPQIQYVDENGMPVDPSLVNPDGTIRNAFTAADETVTNTESFSSTVQHVTADGQPVQLNTAETQLQSSDVPVDTALINDISAATTSAAIITGITPHVSEAASHLPTDQLPNTEETQFIMDPHTGTIYALKDGKATVLTAEANIIMDDPDSLNLPTQTAKVVPDPVAVSNNNGTIATNDSINVTGNTLHTGSNVVGAHDETANTNSKDQTAEACAIQPAVNSVALPESASATNSSSPDAMMPSGVLSLSMDNVSASVSSEGTKTSTKVTTTTVSSMLQTSSSTATSSTLSTTPPTTPRKRDPSPGQTVFKCELCDYRSADKGDVYSHLLHVHSPSKMMMCAKCKKGNCSSIFRTKELCEAHQVNCGKPAVLQCKYCSFTSTSRAMIQGHVKDRHMPKSILKCNRCSFTTRDKAEMLKHVAKHEKGQDSSKDEKKKVGRPVVNKKIVPNVSTISNPCRESITAQSASTSKSGLSQQMKKTASQTTPGNSAPKIHQECPVRIPGSLAEPKMKKIVLAKHSRKETQVIKKDLSDIEFEQEKTTKVLSPSSKSPIPKHFLTIRAEVHKSDDAQDVISDQKEVEESDRKDLIRESDPRLQVNPKVCVSRVENSLELDCAVQLITQKRLNLSTAMTGAFAKKLHPAKYYAKLTKQTEVNLTHVQQKQNNGAKVKPVNSKQLIGADEQKKDISSKKPSVQSVPKKQPKAGKIKMIKRKPNIMDKFFNDTREDYVESTEQNNTEGGRSKRKRKPKMFGHDFVNSEYLTESGVLSDVVSSASSASLDRNSVDDNVLDEEMEDEEENPYRKTYKKHPGSGVERKRKNSGRRKSKQDDEFNPDEMNDFESKAKPPRKRKLQEEFSMSESDVEDDIPRKRTKYETSRRKTESEDELDRLEAALSRGKKVAEVADEIINETALQQSPVKKSLFLGETIQREPKAKGRGRGRKTSTEGQVRKSKKSMDSIRKPIGLDKKSVDQSEEDIEDMMVKYGGEEETEDEDSREALLKQYAAAVKVKTHTNESEGEEDPAKRKRKKKSYGDDFLLQKEKQSPEEKILTYMKRPVGRPPKGYVKPPKMKHTGSKNNPKRGPPPQPKYSIDSTNSSTPSPTMIGQRRVDGMPSPNSEDTSQSLPWVGKLSNILNQVQKSTGDGTSETPNVVKSAQNEGKLGGVRYTLMDKDGKLVMVPLSGTPKRSSSPAAQGHSVLKVARSSASSPSSSSSTSPKVVVAKKSGSPVPGKVLTSLPEGTKIIKLNGKTFLCKTNPVTTTQSSAKGGVQKIVMSSRSPSRSTKITLSDSVKSTTSSSVIQVIASDTATKPTSSVIKVQSSTSSRIVKVSNSPKVVCLPPAANNVQFTQSSLPEKARPKAPRSRNQPVPVVVKTILPKPKPQTITLFPSNQNPQVPSHVVSSGETVLEAQTVETEFVPRVESIETETVPTPVVAASQELMATSDSGVAGTVELDPQDLLQDMTETGEGDIGTEMNQLPGFDSSSLLDPTMQEMLNLL